MTLLNFVFRRTLPVLLVALLPFFPTQSVAEPESDGPYAHLLGTWSGTGSIVLTNGNKERIRCRASYRLDADQLTLRIELRCESDSYKFDLRSQVRYQDGQISGVWSENTRGVAGNITGSLTPTRVQARAEGTTFSALLSMNTRQDRQMVSIRSPGSEMSEVSIVLTRSPR